MLWSDGAESFHVRMINDRFIVLLLECLYMKLKEHFDSRNINVESFQCDRSFEGHMS